MATTLTPQEIQMAKELKSKGYTNTMVMGHIAQTRQGKPSVISMKEVPQEMSFAEDAAVDVYNAGQGIGKAIGDAGKSIFSRFTDKTTGLAQDVVGAGADVFRGVGRSIGNVIGGAAAVATPQGVETAVQEGVGAVGQAIGQTGVAQDIMQAYERQSPEVQEQIKNLLGYAEGLGEIATGGVLGRAGKGVAQGVTQTATKGASTVSKAVSNMSVPEIKAPAGIAQTAKEFGARIPRAVENIGDSFKEAQIRADRIKNATPAVAKAIEAKVPDNTIELVSNADTTTKQAMRQMIDVAESGARDAQPSRIAGDAVSKQYSIIDNQRKAVGKKLEQAIDNLPNATVDMRPAYQQLDEVLNQNGIRVTSNGLDFTQSSLPTQQRTAVERLYALTKEAGDTMNAKMVHAKDRMFSSQKRADMKTEMLDDVYIKVNGETRSIYDTFRDIYRNQLDNLDNGTIRAINKDYAILRNTIDEADNSIFKTSRTKGIELDPSASAMVNLRRLEGEALSTPYFREVADMLDSTSRGLGYSGAKPSDLITFAEDLRAIYPDTIPKAGFTGSIQTAVKPSLLDLADKALSIGSPGLKNQQKALREMLTAQPTSKAIATPPQKATPAPVQKTSSLGNSITEDPAIIQRLTRERGGAGKPSDEFLLASAKRELAKNPDDAKMKAFVSEMELMTEAKKYNSAEEFVKSKITPFGGFSGMVYDDVFKTLQDGTAFSRGGVTLTKRGDTVIATGDDVVNKVRASGVKIDDGGVIQMDMMYSPYHFIQDAKVDVERELHNIWNKANGKKVK